MTLVSVACSSQYAIAPVHEVEAGVSHSRDQRAVLAVADRLWGYAGQGTACPSRVGQGEGVGSEVSLTSTFAVTSRSVRAAVSMHRLQ